MQSGPPDHVSASLAITCVLTDWLSLELPYHSSRHTIPPSMSLKCSNTIVSRCLSLPRMERCDCIIQFDMQSPTRTVYIDALHVHGINAVRIKCMSMIRLGTRIILAATTEDADLLISIAMTCTEQNTCAHGCTTKVSASVNFAIIYAPQSVPMKRLR